MLLTILSRHFYPTVASTGQLLTELATELVKSGINIQVFTSRNVYGFDGSVPNKEVYCGVSINRLPSLGLSKMVKAIDY